MRYEDYNDDIICTLESKTMSVVALRSMLWREPVARRLPEWSNSTLLGIDDFESIVVAFNAIAPENATKTKYATLDGMPVSAMCRYNGRITKINDNPYNSPRADFVTQLLWRAHRLVSSVHIRNSIATCGKYLDNRFIIEHQPEQAHLTNILILGAHEDVK